MKWLHIDFAEIRRFQGLVIIDIHSKWIKAISYCNATATTKIQTSFSSFGLLGEIVNDNQPQFTAELFQKFCRHNGIKHFRTPLIILPLMGQQNMQ